MSFDPTALDAGILFLASFLTVVVCSAAIGGYCWHHWLHPWAQSISAAAELTQAQLNPNGGGTLIDKINRIAPNHAEAQHHWEAIEHRLDAGDRRFDRLEAAIKEIGPDLAAPSRRPAAQS